MPSVGSTVPEVISAERKPDGTWETHDEIIEREALDPRDIDRRIFVDQQGNEKSREQTASELAADGEPPKIPGQGHSTDVNKVAMDQETDPAKIAASIGGMKFDAIQDWKQPGMKPLWQFSLHDPETGTGTTFYTRLS